MVSGNFANPETHESITNMATNSILRSNTAFRFQTQQAFALIATLVLSACGGGGGGGSTPPPALTYTIGGTLSGLDAGQSVVLQNNGGDDLPLSANGTFTFSGAINDGSAFSVTVLTQPAGQTCNVGNGAGSVNGSNVTNVSVTCSGQLLLHVTQLAKTVTINWADAGATSYDLYRSTDRNCDINNFGACAGGVLTTGAASPHTVTGLTDGTFYYFTLKANFASGPPAVSAPAAAKPDTLAMNGAVQAIDIDDSTGIAYMGGGFTSVGARTGSFVPLSAVNSSLAGSYPGVAGSVYAAASDGAGGWFIGGLFSHVGGLVRTNLAHILADGSVDTAWNPAASSAVHALAVSADTVYIAGQFTDIGGVARNRLAAVGATSGIVHSWNPNVANGSVLAVAVADGTVYVGGGFSSVGGTARSNLAAISTGGALQSWAPAANSQVNALVISGSTVYVGGAFTTINSTARNRLAAIGTDGTLSAAWTPSADLDVAALAASGSMIYAGGAFTTLNGVARNRLAAIDTGGMLSPGWNPSANGIVLALAVSGGTVYAGGVFSDVNGSPRSALAAIGTDGTLSAWAPNPSGGIYVIGVTGGTVYAGGAITAINGVTRTRLAAVNADGTLGAWTPSADANVLAVHVAGSTVYVGGQFTQVNSTARASLAGIDTTGALTAWAPSTNGWVYAIDTDPANGTIYVGGSFSTVNGTARSRLAAIAAVGTLVSTWAPGASTTVRAIHTRGYGGEVFVGGDFTTITIGATNTATGNLAIFYPVGDSNSGALLPTTYPLILGGIRALASFDATNIVGGPFATLYVGGNMTTADGNPVGHLLAFVTYPASSGPQLVDMGIDREVAALSVLSSNTGGRLYAGGGFTSITQGSSTYTRNRIAAFDAMTNGVVSDWQPSIGTGLETVYAIGSSASAVHMGGGFSVYNGEPAANFAMHAP
jgi:hypothetical protein